MATSAMYSSRNDWPGGYLALSWFPVLVEIKTGIAIVVPKQYWPQELMDCWNSVLIPIAKATDARREEVERQNEKAARDFLELLNRVRRKKRLSSADSQVPPIYLTDRAAKYLRSLCDQSRVGAANPIFIRVRIYGYPSGHWDSVVEYETKPADANADIAYKHHGVPLRISRKAMPLLVGSTIDYQETSSGEGTHGLLIRNPNFDA